MMKFLNTVMAIILINQFAFSQISISGKILDADSNVPVAYVNIGVKGKKIGTVSDEEGYFTLQKVSLADYIIISSIGFEETEITVQDLKKEGTLMLKPKKYDLDLVELTSTRFNGKEKRYGLKNKTRDLSIGFGSTQLGTEIGSPIPIKNQVYIKSANFVLNHAKGDSLLFRVNIYDFKDGQVGENLLTENIFIREKQRKGVITVDLSNYNIILKSDVFLSLEWLRNFDEIGNKGITFDTKKGKRPRGIYTKWSSNGPFELLSHNQNRNLCFYLIGKEVE